MARVPTYDNFQAQPAGGLAVQFGAVNPVSAQPAIPNYAAEEAKRAGQAMTQAGEVAGKIAARMQEQADQLRLDDALNQVKEEQLRLTYDKDAGYVNQKGWAALKRESGKPLADEYSDALRERSNEIGAGLGNETQKQAFALNSSRMLQDFRARALAHEAQEYKTHSLSVADGVVKTAVDEIGLSYRDPDAVAGAVKRIEAETYRKSRLLGKSAEEAEADAKNLVSHAHKTAIMSALEQNDASYAAEYFARASKAGQMNADDAFAVRGHITKDMQARVSQAAVLSTTKELAPRFAGGSEADRAFHVAVGAESGYRQFGKDGKPLTSKAGAIGIAQVLLSTGPEAAKLAGLPWDEHKFRTDPDYNYTIGKAYYSEQLRVFGGDVEKAWAAYNAGAGRLKDAIKKSERSESLAKNDQNVAPVHWLAFMPSETRAYVAKNSKAFAQGAGRPQAPTELEFVQSAVGRLPAGATAQQVAMTQTQAERQYTLIEKDKKQREDAGFLAAQDALVRNGGNMAALPASIREAIPANRWDDILAFAGKTGKGVPIETDWDLYSQLRGMAAKSPADFGGVDLRLYYGKLAPAQREQLLDLQAKANNPAKQPEVATLSQQLSIAHNQLGLKPSNAADKGKFDDAVMQTLAVETRTKGRELTFEERDKIIKRMMLPTAGGWFSTPRLYEKIGTPGESAAKPKITDDERAMIVAALQTEGVAKPTEAAILERFNRRYGIR